MSGTKNKIEDLRNHLFETIEKLKDGDVSMDIEKAKTIGAIADRIIDSAKVEVEFIKATGALGGTGFIPEDRQLTGASKPNGSRKTLPS